MVDNTELFVLVGVAAGAYFWFSSFSLEDTIVRATEDAANAALQIGEDAVAAVEDEIGAVVATPLKVIETVGGAVAEPVFDAFDTFDDPAYQNPKPKKKPKKKNTGNMQGGPMNSDWWTNPEGWG